MAVRRQGAVDTRARIEKIIEYQAKQIRVVFLNAIQQIKSSKTLKEIATLLENGQFEAALESVSSAAASIGNSYGAALSDAARKTATWLSTSALTVTVSFDQVNANAVSMMQTNKLRLIREFTQDMRDSAQQAMRRGIAEGANPIEQARAFRGSIGLTAKQEAAVANYKRLLQKIGPESTATKEVLTRALRDGRFDRSVLAAAKNKTPIPSATIDRMVERYREKAIKYRAEVIARTEAMSAVNQGSNEMYRQSIASGALNKQELDRTWLAAHDARTRDSHRRLNGTKEPFGTPWQGDNGPIMYPGDPDATASERIHCRCCITTRMNPIPGMA